MEESKNHDLASKNIFLSSNLNIKNEQYLLDDSVYHNSLSIVFPFFNEADGLPTYLSLIYKILKKFKITYQVILVDDGSLDKSYLHAKNFIITNFDKDEQISWNIVKNNRNIGYLQSIKLGINKSKFNNIVILDFDDLYYLEDLIMNYINNKNKIIFIDTKKHLFLNKIIKIYYKIVRKENIEHPFSQFKIVNKKIILNEFDKLNYNDNLDNTFLKLNLELKKYDNLVIEENLPISPYKMTLKMKISFVFSIIDFIWRDLFG
jgi:hypothetical protein